jgi:excisionase family DNA binding protein
MPKSDTLTPLQAAFVLRVSTKTVTRWADAGVLRVVERTPGGQRRFDRADIEAIAAGRGVAS